MMARLSKRAEPGRQPAPDREEASPLLEGGSVDGHVDDGTSEFSAVNEDLTNEQVEIMKASTMYNMVEPLEDGTKKLLFLSNVQCRQIAGNPSAMRKMFDVLEMGQPQLVINLLESHGMREELASADPEFFEEFNLSIFATNKHDNPPFLSREEEEAAQSRIDLFMTEVLVPLAVQTRAVVLANALPQACYLSASFTRAVSAQKAKWGGRMPFTVLSMTDTGWILYANPDLGAYWRDVRRVSKAWRQHDAVLSRMMYNERKRSLDIDRNAVTLIVNDRLDVAKQKFNATPFALLMTELVRTLATSLPSIALRTCGTLMNSMDEKVACCLESSLDMALSGTPVVFLDLRKRQFPDLTMERAELIEQAKEKFSQWCEELKTTRGCCEAFDCCTIAFFHEVLFGDGNFGTVVPVQQTQKSTVPLHEAIRRLQMEEGEATNSSIQPASVEQVADAADWIADRLFKDAWDMLSPPNKEKGVSCQALYAERKYAFATRVRTLLGSSNVFAANLWYLQPTQRLINRIVRLDRLPISNRLEGLLLVRSAWCDYDVAMMLADHYKRISKGLFTLQLVLSWLSVVVSNFASWAKVGDDRPSLDWAKAIDGRPLLGWAASNVERLEDSVFVLSVLITVIISFDSIFNAKLRWRHLRASACKLESIIWQYRTRVGAFNASEPHASDSAAEMVLVHVVNEWRDELMTAAHLKSTNFEKQHPESVYKHFQQSGMPADGQDDFHSPAQPHRYIELRVHPTMAFYRTRIPQYTWAGHVLKSCILFLGVVASILARYKFTSQVAVVMAASTAFTSWMEFSDTISKVDRYSSAVVSLKKLLSWWDSLSEVEKASRENISHLIESSESIIAEERVSWTSTTQRAGAQAAQRKREGKAEAEGSRKANGREAGKEDNPV